MDQVVQEILQCMFDKWMLEPTSKKSTLVYCPVSMESDACVRVCVFVFWFNWVCSYKDWMTTWWLTWRAMGPPAGINCSAVFLAECCGFKAVEEEGTPAAALVEHFQQMAAACDTQGINATCTNTTTSHVTRHTLLSPCIVHQV